MRGELIRVLEQTTAALRELDRGSVPIVDPDTTAAVADAAALLRTLAANEPQAAWAVAAESVAARLDAHLL